MSKLSEKQAENKKIIEEDNEALFLLEVQLDHCHTKIMRQIIVSSLTPLDELHMIIQIAMGWTESHMHVFRTEIGDIAPITEYNDGNYKDECETFLDEIVKPDYAKFKYEYDYGDGWEHTIKVKSFDYKKRIPQDPYCIKAIGACPPEDVGGVSGYENFCNIMNDSKNSEYEETFKWVYQFCGYPESQKWPDGVDIDAINENLEDYYFDDDDYDFEDEMYKEQETHFCAIVDFLISEIITGINRMDKSDKKAAYEIMSQMAAVVWNLSAYEDSLTKLNKDIKTFIKANNISMPDLAFKIMSLVAKIKLEKFNEDNLLIEDVKVTVNGDIPDIEVIFDNSELDDFPDEIFDDVF